MFKRLLITGLSTLFALNAFASDLVFGTEIIPPVYQPIITLSGGPAWASPGQNQYLYPNIPFAQMNYFMEDSNYNALATGEIFFGLQRVLCPWLTGELGLGLAGATDAQVTGTVNVNGAPGVSTFEYKVNHGRTDLKGRLIANSYRFQPYISGSIGAGWNHSHDYRATTINPLFYPAPWFTNETELAFSYTLGLGLQTALNKNWLFGMGYEFADWGQSALGTDATTLINGPSMAHLYTNELLFSISYIFN